MAFEHYFFTSIVQSSASFSKGHLAQMVLPQNKNEINEIKKIPKNSWKNKCLKFIHA